MAIIMEKKGVERGGKKELEEMGGVLGEGCMAQIGSVLRTRPRHPGVREKRTLYVVQRPSVPPQGKHSLDFIPDFVGRKKNALGP